MVVISDKNMLYNTCQLYLAGAETTSTSLEWACYWLIIRPDLQERMQQEIDQNIDPSHLPKLEVCITTVFIINLFITSICILLLFIG